MLAADKLQLQSALKQQATALKEKEFNLHHNNMMTVGTQAAVLAGLDITMFIEFHPPEDSDWGENIAVGRFLRTLYYTTIVAAFCANMTVVAHTTSLSVLGGGLALRGPDGSMMTATDYLYAERTSVFKSFALGLACTLGATLVCVWVMLDPLAALICWSVAAYASRTIFRNYQRSLVMFDYDESETVDFRDIMEGPAAIQAIPTRLRPKKWTSKASSVSSTHVDDEEDEDESDLEQALLTNGRRRSSQAEVKRRSQRVYKLEPMETI